jgi:hypothetical protein
LSPIRTPARDARQVGSGTLSLDTSGTTALSYASGSIQIEGAAGSWEGTCTGASWSAGQSLTLDCWLSGTGAYEGLTYYRYSLTSDAGNTFDGVVMPAPPPSRTPFERLSFIVNVDSGGSGALGGDACGVILPMPAPTP